MDASGKYELQEIQFSREMLYWVYNMLIPEECQLPVSVWLQYDEEQQTIDLPREFQLTATIATISGQDSCIDVSTGAGKTLCMILPCLLTPEHMAIIASPLKWLQAVQVLTFSQYQIKAIAINEDTPSNPDIWQNVTYSTSGQVKIRGKRTL
ncbi:hypothetical protein EDB87DRAFT_1825582 [Lactarius vividus]|nr:hypothetical protein EDB87DRAFT_1825582 [Lactarius vividus]